MLAHSGTSMKRQISRYVKETTPQSIDTSLSTNSKNFLSVICSSDIDTPRTMRMRSRLYS